MPPRNRLSGIAVSIAVGCLLAVPRGDADAQLRLLGSCQTPVESWDLWISGDYAFVTGSTQFLSVVDISQPSNPQIVAYYDQTSDPWGIDGRDGYLYIASDGHGLHIVDISDPLEPLLAGSFDGDLYEHDVDALEDVAFLMTCRRMYVIDISNPADPVEISNIEMNSLDSNGILVEGSYAYVMSDFTEELVIIDVSDRENPVLRGSCPDLRIWTGWSTDLIVRGDYAYIPTVDGLQIIDISDPDNPSSAGVYSALHLALGICAAQNYLFLADDIYGLTVLDFSDPVDPVFVDRYDTDGYGYRDVCWSNGLIVAIRDSQLDTFAFGALDIDGDESKPDVISYLHSYPNPFNSSASINFGIKEQSDVSVSIYNLLGRKVAAIFDGVQNVGEYSVSWDASGYPSGVYFARLESGRRSEAVKMVLLK